MIKKPIADTITLGRRFDATKPAQPTDDFHLCIISHDEITDGTDVLIAGKPEMRLNISQIMHDPDVQLIAPAFYAIIVRLLEGSLVPKAEEPVAEEVAE